ncbi:hypothetical protein JW933_08220 [candidate division FCPU426 bacterium]|nr:hypothetical protein [candidate division FCPU426 bacterium]
MDNEKNWMIQIRQVIIPAVVLISLLLIVWVRFAELGEKTREGTTVGRLHDLRQAILLYYQDHNGVFPRTLSPTAPFGRYMETMLPVDSLHPRGGAVSPAGAEVTYGTDVPRGYGRGWYYNYESGQIFVNSIGWDSRGIPYSAY